MSFFSKALQGAEKLLEQVDEGVSQASRRIEESAKAVSGLVRERGAVRDGDSEEDEEWNEDWDEDWEEDAEDEEDDEDGEDEEEAQDEEHADDESEHHSDEAETEARAYDQEKDVSELMPENPTEVDEEEQGGTLTETRTAEDDEREGVDDHGDVQNSPETVKVTEFEETRSIEEGINAQVGKDSGDEGPRIEGTIEMPADDRQIQITSDGNDNSPSEELERYRQQLSAYEDRIEELERTAAAREAEMQKSAGKIKSLQIGKRKSEGLRSKSDEQVAQLNKELQALRKNCDRLENELEKMTAKAEKMTEKAEKAAEMADNLEDELDTANEEVQKLQVERESIARSSRQSTELVDHLERENRELKQKLSSFDSLMSKERNEWKEKVEGLQDEIDELERILGSERKQKLKMAEDAENEKTQSVATLTKTLNEVKVDKAVLEAENERLKDIVNREKEAGVANSDSARRDVSSALQELEREMEAHRKTEKAARIREEALETTAASAAEALVQTEKRAQAERELLTKVTDELKEKKHQLFGEENARREAETKLAAAEASQMLLASLENKMTSTEEELEGLRADNANLKQTVAEQQAALKQSELQNRQISEESRNGNEIAEMETQVRSLADATLHKQSQVELLRGENKALQMQLELERRRTREAQNLAQTFASQKSSRERDLEAGGGALRLRTQLTSPFGAFVERFDRFALGVLSGIRREPLLRMVFVAYLIFTHIFTYLVLHHSSTDMHSEPLAPAGASVAPRVVPSVPNT